MLAVITTAITIICFFVVPSPWCWIFALLGVFQAAAWTFVIFTVAFINALGEATEKALQSKLNE